ncbi:MAG: hypothetical protein ACRDYX_21635 [Egibacteraceae bacterium]
MSAPLTADDMRGPAVEYDPQRPYRNYETSTLVEMLERSYDQETPFNELVVFELVHRLAQAETALRTVARTT